MPVTFVACAENEPMMFYGVFVCIKSPRVDTSPHQKQANRIRTHTPRKKTGVLPQLLQKEFLKMKRNDDEILHLAVRTVRPLSAVSADNLLAHNTISRWPYGAARFSSIFFSCLCLLRRRQISKTAESNVAKPHWFISQ